MTTGFFLFAYVVGHISDVIELQDSENRHFVAKLSSLRQLLRHFDLPPRVEEKFKNYFFFKRFHSITQEHVLERVLPPSLVVDMRMFQLQPMIVKVAFLVGMEDSVTRMLVSLFTQVLFVKDEFICHFGEEGSEMFFIYTGVLDIFIPFLSPSASTLSGSPSVFPTSATGGRVSLSGLRKVNEITAGSYFGEAALFTNTPRNANNSSDFNVLLMKHKLLMQEVEVDVVESNVQSPALTLPIRKQKISSFFLTIEEQEMGLRIRRVGSILDNPTVAKTQATNLVINFAFAIVISFVGQLVMALMIAEMANIFLLYINNEVQFRKNHLIVERSLARLVLATAQLAVNQKKTAAVFVANRFKSDDYDEDIESSDSSNDDVSDDDASKSEREGEMISIITKYWKKVALMNKEKKLNTIKSMQMICRSS
ncbi:hypothetical protein PInf_014465 [Phytophthora infestans]|nr:hypothetical protein PInf_014465 [Phytophthora infestans]